jgi:ABC-type polysaccharide/polyol phosphate transport system ATPase subunit
MDHPSIIAQGLTKVYRRGKTTAARPRKAGLGDYLKRAVTLVRATGGIEFRALDNVCLEVEEGDVFGVVGRNGAGKSTLLKILARITLPTSGRAEIYGRVSSLLEVGTGFHPELTGRENIYLSGSILGMRKADIARRFDEIVAFSELEAFLETPVKHYSSGMYVRLAFSVAAHLEPDVLLADEVLAVGDSNFWTKSINKMRSLNAQGMTIVLVTHDLYLIQSVCKRAICVHEGRIVADGLPVNVISKYRALNLDQGTRAGDATLGNKPAKILSLFREEGELFPDSPLAVFVRAQVRDGRAIRFMLRIVAHDGLHYFTVYSKPVRPTNGCVACEATIPRTMLMPGSYYLWGAVCTDNDDRTILAEDSIPLLIKGSADHLHRLNFLWNEAQWSFTADEPITKEEGLDQNSLAL